MAYNPYLYDGYQSAPNYYPGPVPDQLSQLRMQRMGPNQPMQNLAQPMPQPQMVPQGQSESSGIIWVQGEAGAFAFVKGPWNIVKYIHYNCVPEIVRKQRNRPL